MLIEHKRSSCICKYSPTDGSLTEPEEKTLWGQVQEHHIAQSPLKICSAEKLAHSNLHSNLLGCQ